MWPSRRSDPRRGARRRVLAARPILRAIMPGLRAHAGELPGPIAAIHAKYLQVAQMRDLDTQARSPLGRRTVRLMQRPGLVAKRHDHPTGIPTYPPGTFTPEDARERHEMDGTKLAGRMRGILTRATEEPNSAAQTWFQRVLQGMTIPGGLAPGRLGERIVV